MVSPIAIAVSENVDISGRARYPLVKAHGQSITYDNISADPTLKVAIDFGQ